MFNLIDLINTVKILFVMSKTRVKKRLIPIACRLTFKEKRKPFASGLFIKPKSWKSKLQEAVHPINIMIFSIHS